MDNPRQERDSLMVQAQKRALRSLGGEAVTDDGARRDPTRGRGLNPFLLMGPMVGAGADGYTTDRYFDAVREANGRAAGPDSHYEVTGREENPLLRGIAENDAALYAIKGGVGLGISGLAELLARKGHRNLGKGVAIAGTVLPMALAFRNMSRTDALRKATP